MIGILQTHDLPEAIASFDLANDNQTIRLVTADGMTVDVEQM